MTARLLCRFFSMCLMLNAGPGWAQGPSPRTDPFGDPLPPGALARIGTVRWRPDSGVGWSGSALAPDGRTLFVSGSGRGDSAAIQVFDVETGRLVRIIRGADQSTGSIAVSPDGKVLAAGGYKGIALWDLDTGKRTRMKAPLVGCPAGDNILHTPRACARHKPPVGHPGRPRPRQGSPAALV